MLTTPAFVVLDADLVHFEAALSTATGSARLAPLVALSWHLRQRDGHRARTLAGEARDLLTGADVDDTTRRRVRLRLSLAEAEARWLFAEIDAAQSAAVAAVDEAEALGDAVLGADAQWLLATLATERGDVALRDAALAACERLATRAGDTQRVLVAQGAAARWAVFTDPRQARERWAATFRPADRDWPAGAATWVHDFLGNLAASDGDFSAGTLHRLRQHEDAVATGQWQRAIIALTNIGACFANLNDLETALHWVQRGLDEARRLGWPGSTAGALMQVGGVLHQLGRLEAARELLLEARSMPGVSAASRNHALAVQYLGEVYLDLGQWEQAVEAFEELEGRAVALRQSDMLMESMAFRAAGLAGLGRVDEALAITEDALRRCREQGRGAIEIIMLEQLARLHAQRRERAGGRHPDDEGAVLRCLRQAVEAATAIDGYRVTAELHEALAAEYAHAGDWRQAYEASRQGAAAREKTVSAAALNRSVAMQITHQTERARAEAEHHRSLAGTLQRTTATLEALGEIGREVTRHLEESAVFDALARHVDSLLDKTHFGIYLLEERGDALRMAFGVEDGSPLRTDLRLPIDNPTSNVARCARTREEFAFGEPQCGPNPNHIPGTVPTASAMFAPLVVGDRLLGVMTIQSPHPHAYGERERLIFRTLCAYGAIGLHNARAYRRLEGTLGELQGARDELARKNALLEHAHAQQQEASLTDPLTQLRNRRFLMQHIEDEVAITQRRHDQRLRGATAGSMEDNGDLAFFMVDIDHFKSINDRHGHAAGDRVLVQVAQRLREVVRETDYLIRWGGEEFLIVARATHADEGAALAERLRRAVAGRPFDLGEGGEIERTCSIGFAAFPFHREAPGLATWSEITRLADQALYLAKAGGRNRWVGLHAPAGEPPSRAGFDQLCRDPAAAVARGELVQVRGGT